MEKVDYIELAEKFLDAARTGREMEERSKSLAEGGLDVLIAELSDDSRRNAFWVNIYNAFTIYFLRKEPELLEAQISRARHFTAKKVRVAGHDLSLNEIEHGILRRSKLWWSKGFLNHPFPPSPEKMLRVDQMDPRIHFALNCGGKSCPPIRFYQASKLEAQLEMASESFLSAETSFDAGANIVSVSRILDWYAGDFGGRKGILKWLKRYHLIPEDSNPSIRFHPYDWTTSIDVFLME